MRGEAADPESSVHSGKADGSTPFFLDPYSVPVIDYFARIGQGDPVSIREFGEVQEALFSALHDLERSWRSPSAKAALRIGSKQLIVNLSNLYYVSELVSRILDMGFQPVLTPDAEMTDRMGARNLAPSYLHDYLAGRTPFIDYWLRGISYRPLRSFVKRILTAATRVRYRDAVYNPAPRTIEHLKREDRRFHVLYDHFFWPTALHPRRTDGLELPPTLPAFEDAAARELSAAFMKHGQASGDLHEHVTTVVRRVFRKAAFDLATANERIAGQERLPGALYSGTCGNYKTRVAMEALKGVGVETHAFMHSGAIAHLDYNFDPRLYIEYQIPQYFHVFTSGDLATLSRTTAQFQMPVTFRAPNCGMSHRQTEPRTVRGEDIRSVVIVGMSQSPTIRRLNLPSDLMYLDYERQLLASLLRIPGVDIYIKPHPKASRPALDLSAGAYPSVRYLKEMSMHDAIDTYDAFIINFADSTAFNEVMASQKPAILVDPSGVDFTGEARKSLKNRVAFVDCGFDSNGLAWLDETQLRAAFKRAYVLDDEFATRFQERKT